MRTPPQLPPAHVAYMQRAVLRRRYVAALSRAKQQGADVNPAHVCNEHFDNLMKDIPAFEALLSEMERF